jgi:hypothetical protein
MDGWVDGWMGGCNPWMPVNSLPGLRITAEPHMLKSQPKGAR